MKNFIICEPRGTYDATMCPVCGSTDTEVVDSFAERDWLMEETTCKSCGTEYTVTWHIGTISSEKRGVVG